MAGKKQIHAGHRQRMHDRVSQYGLESLAEHEVLEYLLYFTNAQRNTNPIAHALLEQFGDLAGVLEATEAELCQVEGVGPRQRQAAASASPGLHMLQTAAGPTTAASCRRWNRWAAT